MISVSVRPGSRSAGHNLQAVHPTDTDRPLWGSPVLHLHQQAGGFLPWYIEVCWHSGGCRLLKRNGVKTGLCINCFQKRQDSNNQISHVRNVSKTSDCLETEREIFHAHIPEPDPDQPSCPSSYLSYFLFISTFGTRALVVWGPPQTVMTIHVCLTEERPTGAQWTAWGQ